MSRDLGFYAGTPTVILSLVYIYFKNEQFSLSGTGERMASAVCRNCLPVCTTKRFFLSSASLHNIIDMTPFSFPCTVGLLSGGQELDGGVQMEVNALSVLVVNARVILVMSRNSL